MSTSGTYTLAPGDYSLWFGTAFGNTANADGSHGKNFALNITAAPVPLPAALWLLGSALFGLAASMRRPA